MSNLGYELPVMTVALAGNPNSGKTTVFNALTRMRQKVGNYPGVTVEKKIGALVHEGDTRINILDLPGTYSLAVRSPDEAVARDVLMGRMPGTRKPDLVVCVVDASNLERNLYLVSQIQDLGVPVLLALNMMDEAQKRGKAIDIQGLSDQLGVPVVPMVAHQNEGLDQLTDSILRRESRPFQRRWRMPEPMEQETRLLAGALEKEQRLDPDLAFVEALFLISFETDAGNEESSLMQSKYGSPDLMAAVVSARQRLNAAGTNWRSAAIESRYAWIKQVLQAVVRQEGQPGPSLTNRIDAFLTHPVLGWIFFLGLMGGMFFLIFSIASYPMEWIDQFFSFLGARVQQAMPEGDLRLLLADGVIPGVGGVVVFLPQIMILFFFISLLQDTGYMARAAFMMDRIMSRFGLHGKSFIPLLSSYACAIPGIMAARTIESPKDRLVTLLVAPLMSCSARLPVYTIMIAVMMPDASAFEKAGIMCALYLLGTVTAGIAALILKKTMLKAERPIFIMELPPYRFPTWKAAALQMWERARMFLKRAGTVILGMSIVLWVLMTYPKYDHLEPGVALKKSIAGQFGVLIEPAIKPLGYDWRIGVGLLGSFAAREVFVSTMSIVFNVDDQDGSKGSLREAFQQAHWPDGRRLFTPLVCVSIMVFFVFSMQCLSTVAVVYRETDSIGWTSFQLLSMTTLAYIAALIVYQGGRLLGWH